MLVVLSACCACGDNLEFVPRCDEVPDTSATSSYDDLVLADGPVAFWDITGLGDTERDLTGNGRCGAYFGTTRRWTTMPDGARVADFNGSDAYMFVGSNEAFSIPTTGSLTWEAWIEPDVLQFPNSPEGYVNWMGKCASYAPTCEWEARLHDSIDPQGRCNRFAAYAFNPSAGLGAGADWQPTCGLLQPGQWHHVVGEYTIGSQPAGCPNVATAPGSITIFVDGIEWSQADHNPTGCMSQFGVVPRANDSPLFIGTSAADNWFQGGIGKVAIYGYLLGADQIANHYLAMTGRMPSGSCGATCTIP
ncbi:MAG: LamG protein [Myxococcales bacterium]|nr:LamG protein [Myxococcales bacterium]